MAEENNQKFKLDPEQQYNLLLKCSNARNMDEWNNFRENYPDVDIDLEARELGGKYLKGANLKNANLYKAKLNSAELRESNLIEADLEEASLKHAKLINAKLQKANLNDARLQEAYLNNAELQGAELKRAKLNKADLSGAKLQDAKLQDAKLQSTKLNNACLQNAEFCESDCRGTRFNDAKLESAQFNLARVDGLTTFTKCDFDRDTNFSGVGLDAASIEPELKAAFKDNIRRIKWQEWFCKGNWTKKLSKLPLSDTSGFRVNTVALRHESLSPSLYGHFFLDRILYF